MDDKNKQDQSQDLPQILVLRPPPFFTKFEEIFFNKFHILKAWESSLSIETFLTTYAHSVKAMLCSGGTPITTDVLRLLPSLQLLVTTSAGLNHIDLPECRRRGIAVANAGTVFSEDVADITVGLLIDVLRKMSAADRYVRRELWANKGEYPLGSKIREARCENLTIISTNQHPRSTLRQFLYQLRESVLCRIGVNRKLSGKRIGIVGLGSIGLEVAKRLEAFGCIISYNSRKKKSSISYPYFSNICELASNSDALIICCALTDQTRHMINMKVLLALGKDGVIVNIARGSVINEKEMVRCLVQGEIGGAGLDVFENEPQVPKELFELDNVVLSPHLAVHTSESFLGLYELLVGNFEAFFSNKPLLSPVMDD